MATTARRNFQDACRKAKRHNTSTRCNYLGDIVGASAADVNTAFGWMKERTDVCHLFSTNNPLEFLSCFPDLFVQDWPEHIGIEISARTVQQVYVACAIMRAFKCKTRILRLQPWTDKFEPEKHVLDLSAVTSVLVGGYIGKKATPEMQATFGAQLPVLLAECAKQKVECKIPIASGPTVKQGIGRRDAMLECLSGVEVLLS